MNQKGEKTGQVYFEFYPPVQGMRRVIAIDGATGTEVTLAGDAAQSEKTLMNIARKKLEYVLAKKRST